MTAHEWDSDQFWNKATIYFERGRGPTVEQDTRLLWNCLALEHLARAVLTSVNRALNADPQGDGSHLLYACGFPHQKQPKSIPAHAVINRLKRMFDEFQPHTSICEEMFHLRNAELHSGSTRLLATKESAWLGRFYGAVMCLVGLLGRALEELLEPEEAAHAQELAAAAAEKNKKGVQDRISAARRAFEALPSAEQDERRRQAGAALAYKSSSGCPACTAKASVTGFLLSESTPHYAGGLYVERVFAVDNLSCRSCGLDLRGVAECSAGGVEPRVSVHAPIDIHDAHIDEEDQEYDNM